MSEETIAALDGDWKEFSPAERAAFRLTRKLTYAPHTVGDKDLDALREHYKDLQALEIIITLSRNNSTTRWTETLGIPTEEHRTFITPTPEKYRSATSLVAPLAGKAPKGDTVCAAYPSRPKLESREEAEAALKAARGRAAHFPLVSQKEARKLLGKDWPGDRPVPAWARLLLNFPKDGHGRVLSFLAAERHGTLDQRLKAQVYWIAARQDRAWYAAGQAKRRLRALGLSEDEVYALDGPWDKFPPAERKAFAFARKLTVTPGLMTDADIAGLRKHYSDKQVAELVFHTANAAYFNRLTEASALPLEGR